MVEYVQEQKTTLILVVIVIALIAVGAWLITKDKDDKTAGTTGSATTAGKGEESLSHKPFIFMTLL